MMDCEIVRPESERELFEYMERPSYELVAGGTDVFVKMKKEDGFFPDLLVDLGRVEQAQGIINEGDQIVIGSLTTHRELVESELVRSTVPILSHAAERLGSVQIRNVGTIGGNVCNASPSGDTLVPLYLLQAKINVESRNTSRTLSIDKFIEGPGEIALNKGEYVRSITVPLSGENFLSYFKKVGRRNALEIAICSMGFLLRAEGSAVEELRLAYGSVAPTVVRVRSVEEYVRGKELTPELITEVEDLVRGVISPIDDLRAGKSYREKVALQLLHELSRFIR